MTRAWVVRLLVVLLAGLLSSGYVWAADSYWVYAQTSVYWPGQDQQVGGASQAAACGNAGYVRWGSNADVRVYTAFQSSPVACLLYSDSSHVTYLGSWQINGAGWGPTTPTLQFWDGWCNSAESCSAAGYTSSSGGAGGTVTFAFPELRSDQVADYMSLWSLFLGVAVVVLIGKSIYNRFRIDHEA